ncbi:MAG: anthranilate phosphoribosyltransferase [Candidatus Hydrogenedentes bacterium]|nr:anthranilate phosphoribosyltransferase [Candidatus Hydrogenedentota bacterium]
MTIHEIITQLCDGTHLTRDQAARAMHLLMSGELSSAQTAALLIALRMKGETAEEISGFAGVMRDFSTKVSVTRTPLVDTCGTGGDGSGTFNISTTAAFVAAGAGAAVAKHGNRAASSKCGSADVLEALGVAIDLDAEQMGRCVDEIGIGFLFARTLHRAMKHVAPVRMELRVRTVFNILGPLTNPAGADRQVLGVFSRKIAPVMAEALLSLGSKHAFVVTGMDGLDELTLAGPSLVCEARNGDVQQYELHPETLGFSLSPTDALAGGDADRNAALLRAVLEGETGPRRDVVLLNAAPALVAYGLVADMKEGIECAAAAIDSGAAVKKLESLIAFTQGVAE